MFQYIYTVMRELLLPLNFGKQLERKQNRRGRKVIPPTTGRKAPKNQSLRTMPVGTCVWCERAWVAGLRSATKQPGRAWTTGVRRKAGGFQRRPASKVAANQFDLSKPNIIPAPPPRSKSKNLSVISALSAAGAPLHRESDKTSGDRH